MIKILKRQLTFLFISSVMFIFTVVFCILIAGNIRAERKSNIDFFNRISTSLIFALENTSNSNIEKELQNVEKNCSMFLLFFDKEQNVLYQSSNIFDEDAKQVIESFQKEATKEEVYNLNNTPSSSVGSSFLFQSASGMSYIGIKCDVVIADGSICHLYIIKDFENTATVLKYKLPYYCFIWLIVFATICILAHLIIRKALKPTEVAVHSQKDFIASVSHELKSPLAVILSSSEAIGSFDSPSEQLKNQTKVIDAECLRMSKLIHNLLLLSSIDTKTWTLNKSNVNIDSLMIRLFEKFEPLCRKHNLNMNLDIEDISFPPFLADADRLEQLLSIFLDNAINYSYPDSEISLSAALVKNTIVFTITDHGKGIADKDKPFIYDRFYCADKSRTQKEHYGLGLSIAKELVAMHHGTIILSDTPGGGCTFQIKI